MPVARYRGVKRRVHISTHIYKCIVNDMIVVSCTTMQVEKYYHTRDGGRRKVLGNDVGYLYLHEHISNSLLLNIDARANRVYGLIFTYKLIIR